VGAQEWLAREEGKVRAHLEARLQLMRTLKASHHDDDVPSVGLTDLQTADAAAGPSCSGRACPASEGRGRTDTMFTSQGGYPVAGGGSGYRDFAF
jgi:hypothetical protein